MKSDSFSAQSVAILGRQPSLGIAELERLLGEENVKPFGTSACLLTAVHDTVPFYRLGGSVKLAKILQPVSKNSWTDIEKQLLGFVTEYASSINGKLTFGLSVYGLVVSPKTVNRTAFTLKKALKQAGNSVRMVPHTEKTLSSAVVLHNKLTGPHGLELVVVSDGTLTYIAQTTHIQDIDAYAARDQARPYRDAKVGMLPPKLAQIIINLAVGAHNTTDHDHSDLNRRTLILDPFCGTGVLLQEAMLMGYDLYGSDIDPRMVQYTIDNLAWLDKKYPNVGDYRRIEIADATTHSWSFLTDAHIVVACETYLGKPLSTLPPSDQLSTIIFEANQINHRFLQNIAKKIPSGTRLCLAMPSWRGTHEFLHLPLLDHLTDMGYTRAKFKHVSNDDLIYHRSNQIVARELVVLEKD